MPEKPRTAAGYAGTHRDAIMAACLDIAVCLGDQVDNFVFVGGLVPSLLVPGELLPPDTEAHPGTRDIDLGLHVTARGRCSCGDSTTEASGTGGPGESPVWRALQQGGPVNGFEHDRYDAR